MKVEYLLYSPLIASVLYFFVQHITLFMEKHGSFSLCY